MFFYRRIPGLLRGPYHYDSLSAFFFGIFNGSVLIFLPIVARRMGASVRQIALLTSGPFIGFLFTLFWAHLSEDKKKMPYVIWPGILSRSLFLFMLFVVKPAGLVAIALLFYLIAPIMDPAYASIMKEIYPDKHRGKVMGYVRVEMALSTIGAAYAGGYLLEMIGYKYLFPLGAIFGILASLSFRRIGFVENGNPKQTMKKFSLVEMVRILDEDRAFLGFSAIFFLFGFGNLLAMPLYPLFLVDRLDIPNSTVGELGALFSLLWMASYFFWGEYIDRKGPLLALDILFLLMSFVPLLYFLARNIWLVVIATAFSGIASGGLDLSWFNSTLRFTGSRNGLVPKYAAIQTTLMGLRGVIAPFLGVGLMHLLGMRTVFMLSFALILTSFLLMRSFKRRASQGTEEDLPAAGDEERIEEWAC